VKTLEAELGFKLFNRERQRLVITDAGREYLNVVFAPRSIEFHLLRPAHLRES
jgi:DNA-binding transcriptional LysR family regulator